MDGAGKSTLSKLVVDKLAWEKPPQLMVYPSHDGPVGQLIRKVFSREVVFADACHGTQDRVLGYLMTADGIDREDKLREHLANGTPVVCDRHTIVSAWAYQTECMSIDELMRMQNREQFMQPDVTFIVDVPAELAIERMRQRGEIRNPIYERDGIDYVDRLRRRYLAFAVMHPDVVVLDGQLSTDALLLIVDVQLRALGIIPGGS